jgi:hypothetical protein
VAQSNAQVAYLLVTTPQIPIPILAQQFQRMINLQQILLRNAKSSVCRIQNVLFSPGGEKIRNAS